MSVSVSLRGGGERLSSMCAKERRLDGVRQKVNDDHMISCCGCESKEECV